MTEFFGRRQCVFRQPVMCAAKCPETTWYDAPRAQWFSSVVGSEVQRIARERSGFLPQPFKSPATSLHSHRHSDDGTKESFIARLVRQIFGVGSIVNIYERVRSATMIIWLQSGWYQSWNNFRFMASLFCLTLNPKTSAVLFLTPKVNFLRSIRFHNLITLARTLY